MNDKISFIVPAYNCADTIEESVNSIMRTNFSDGDELVIVNDESIDATAAVIEKIKRKYQGVTIVTNRYNLGEGLTRNVAIAHTNHEIIFNLDADNVLPDRCIPALKDFLIGSGYPIACFEKMLYFEQDIKHITHMRIYEKEVYAFRDFFKTDKVPAASGNLMFTKASWLAVHGYPEGPLGAWAFGLRQAAQGFKTGVLRGVGNSFYYHRIGIESEYVREQKKGTPGIFALQCIIPYLDQLHPADVRYVLSETHRFHWLETLDARPLRFKDEKNILDDPFVKRVQNTLKGVFRS